MDNLLKQRLVGAVVLVALGVIFIPMLLEGPNRTLVPDMDEMPEPETLAPELPLEPFPPAEAPQPPQRAIVTEPAGTATSAGSADEAPQTPPEPVTPPPVPALPQPAAEPVKPPVAEKPDTRPAAAPVPDKAADSWVVQVVSLSSKANALALRDKLRKGGFATQVEQVRIDGKTHYRVRVGPFLERADADRAREQIAQRFAQNGRVMSAR